MEKHNRIVDQVEYGLDTISDVETLTLPLRDFMYAFQTLGEFIRFFHQPLHYEDLSDVLEFLGRRGDGGGIDILFESYYRRLREHIPSSIEDALHESVFDNPEVPDYYTPR